MTEGRPQPPFLQVRSSSGAPRFVIRLITYYDMRMIRSFKSRALKSFFTRGEMERIAPAHRDTVKDILARLNAAASPNDMDMPGFFLHRLKGDHAGFWAVTVRANWRVIFRFEDGEPADVDYLDYH